AAGARVRMLLARRFGRAPVLDRDVDPRGGHELPSLEPWELEAERSGQALDRLDVAGLEREAREPGAEHVRPGARLEQQLLELLQRQSVGLGHEHRGLARLE